MYTSTKEKNKLKKEIESFQCSKQIEDANTLHTNSLIRIKRVIALTGISKSYIYQLCEKGLFPKSIQLVDGGVAVAWVESEILDWIQSRIQARDEEMTNA